MRTILKIAKKYGLFGRRKKQYYENEVMKTRKGKRLTSEHLIWEPESVASETREGKNLKEYFWLGRLSSFSLHFLLSLSWVRSDAICRDIFLVRINTYEASFLMYVRTNVRVAFPPMNNSDLSWPDLTWSDSFEIQDCKKMDRQSTIEEEWMLHKIFFPPFPFLWHYTFKH